MSAVANSRVVKAVFESVEVTVAAITRRRWTSICADASEKYLSAFAV